MIIKQGIHTTASGEIFQVNRKKFYVDLTGIKSISRQNETDQEINCNFNDELINDSGRWRVKNEADLYQEEYARVDKIRQEEYTNRVRPYIEEAEIKKHMGMESERERLMNLAVQEREKIKLDNPWPERP